MDGTLTQSFRLADPILNLTIPVEEVYFKVEAQMPAPTGGDYGDSVSLRVMWLYQPQKLETGPEPTPSSAIGAEPTTVPTPSPELSPTPFTPSGPLNADCSIDQAEFDQEWLKYSDLDDRIPLKKRSYEAQQYAETAQRIIDLGLKSFNTQAVMELDAHARRELREYRNALVRNQRNNLVKAFIRLAYITYDTAAGTPGLGKGARGLAPSYGKLFSEEATALEKLGGALKVAQGLTPKDSRFALNTKEVTGKVEAVGLSGVLDALESLGNPREWGKGVAQEVIKQTIVPSADLTDEEIGILREQHLNERLLDEILQESYRLNSDRRNVVKQLEMAIDSLEDDLREWEEKEKQRVEQDLEAGCLAQTGQ